MVCLGQAVRSAEGPLLGMPGFGHTTFSLNSQLGCFGCLEGMSLANQGAPGGLGSGI